MTNSILRWEVSKHMKYHATPHATHIRVGKWCRRMAYSVDDYENLPKRSTENGRKMIFNRKRFLLSPSGCYLLSSPPAQWCQNRVTFQTMIRRSKCLQYDNLVLYANAKPYFSKNSISLALEARAVITPSKARQKRHISGVYTFRGRGTRQRMPMPNDS